MDRNIWKQERRLWNEVQMDTIYARQYDAHWGSHINSSHRTMVERLLTLCPPGGTILDAACGTGKYWSMLLDKGFSVMGTDQSQKMLQQAHAKFPNVPVEHVGLQELTFPDMFDAIM
jgi:ubiquinone/menaquinone biosynthesis C-methylase UbiE